MAEIAKRAGVSRATASLVINDRDAAVRISAATRLRVLAVAEEMGYRRNELARAVVTGKNFVLGMLERPSGLEQKACIMGGALAAADAYGYHIKVWPWPEREKIMEVARRCVEQRLAGLVVIRPTDVDIDELHAELTRYNIPMVLVDDHLAQPWAINIASDDEQGSRQAMSHLIELGHRRIACVAGKRPDSLSAIREQSYRAAMNACGLPVPDGYVLSNNWSFAGTEECIRRLFCTGQEPPTALFMAAGDAYAAVAIRMLRGMEIAVPRDVSVLGYADLGLAEVIDPPLTTISQPFSDMGRVAVEVLMSLIASPGNSNKQLSPNYLMPTRLIVRTSTAPVSNIAQIQERKH